MNGGRLIAAFVVLAIAVPLGVARLDRYDRYRPELLEVSPRGPAAASAPVSREQRMRAAVDLLTGRSDAAHLVDDGPGVAFALRDTSQLSPTSPTSPATVPSTRPPAISPSSSARARTLLGLAGSASASGSSMPPLSLADLAYPRGPLDGIPRAAHPAPAGLAIDTIQGDSSAIQAPLATLARAITTSCHGEIGHEGVRFVVRLQLVGDAPVLAVSLSLGPDEFDPADLPIGRCVEALAKAQIWPPVSTRTLIVARVTSPPRPSSP